MNGVLVRARRRSRRAVAVSIVSVATIVGGSVAWAAGGPTPRAVDPAQVEVFVGVTPTRVFDSRRPTPNPFGAGETRVISLAGWIDPRVSSVAINITLDADATSQSFITVWPTGEPRPDASANNAEPGIISPNQMIAKLGSDQSFSVYNERGSTNVIIDVVGVLVPLDEVAVGATGGVGSTFLSGAGAPEAGAGDVGDLYFDTAAKAFYGPKSTSGWGSAVTVQGATGATGATGPPGATGVAGPPGPAGGAIEYAYGATGSVAGTMFVATVLNLNPATSHEFGEALDPVDTGDAGSNPDTFDVATAGLYEVAYAVPLVGSGLTATLELRINGVAEGGAFPASGGTVSRTQVVSLQEGDDLALWIDPGSVGAVSLSAPHTITIKKIA